MNGSQVLDQGIEAHSRGDLAAARRVYEGILAVEPNNADALHLLGLVEYQQRQFGPALSLIRRALAVNGSAALFHNSLGLVLLQQKQLSEAEGSFRKAIALEANFAEAYSNLAGVCVRQGRLDEAVKHADRAIGLNRNLASAHCHLGEATYKLGRGLEARRAFGVALAIEPTNAEALNGLGLLLVDDGRFAEAQRCFERAVTHHPNHSASHTNLGNILGEQGRATDALGHHERAAKLDPDSAPIAAALAATYHALSRFDEAIRECKRAIRLDPGLAVAHANLGSALAQTGQTESAKAAYGQAITLRPDPGLQIRSVMTIPPILESVDQIDRVREELAAGIAGLMAQNLHVRDPLREIGATLFYLAYHGLVDRDLQREAARLYSRVCPSLLWEAPHAARKERKAGKIHVGFISAYLYNHSVGKTSSGLIAHLSREKFRVTAIHAGAPKDDEISKFLAHHADQRVVLQPALAAARQQVAALNLDILFYQDIGMDALTYLLAFSRLAPVQCTSFGHPDTTGIHNIDYWISCELFEPENAQEHYSEKLHLLGNSTHFAYYFRPRVPNPLKPRAAFGLPEDKTIYLCPQTLFKFHPDFDVVLGSILRADPHGQIVLIQGKVRHWAELLRARFERQIPEVASRIVFLPSQAGGDFTNLIAVSDVMLDTPHFNGYNTSLEAFAAGTPVVTIPKLLQRGRHTAGMYARMGISECVASSDEDYVRVAVRLGTDREFNQHMRRRILERSHFLYEDMNVVREYERFFLEAAQAPG